LDEKQDEFKASRQLGRRVGSDKGVETSQGTRAPPLAHPNACILLLPNRPQIAKGQPRVETLVSELENFGVKISVSGDESSDARREIVHDEPVLSTAIAVWQAESPPQPVRHLLNRMRDLQ